VARVERASTLYVTLSSLAHSSASRPVGVAEFDVPHTVPHSLSMDSADRYSGNCAYKITVARVSH